jgi:dienelactone hydrolase
MSLPRGRVLGLAMLALVLLCLSQVPHAQTADPREAIVQHHLEFIPSGDGPFPTIVAIPGCSGIAFADAEREANHPGLADDDRLFRRHYREVSRRLRDAGYAVYLIDVHGAEGVLTACAGEISGERLGEHIDEAVAWAAERSQVDSSRMHIIGWSMGGWGVLDWLHGP